MLCTHKTTILCQFGLFCHQLTTISINSQPVLVGIVSKSAENDSDIMIKNQQGQHYMYAKSKLVYVVQEMNEKKGIQDEETWRMLES